MAIVEGIDLKAGDVPTNGKTASIGDAHLVARIMRRLQKAAKTHHFALLASIGSPKQKGKEQYTSKRDMIIGSQAWARMAETVVHIAPEDANAPKNIVRVLSFLPRNGKDEVIRIDLDENGRPRVAVKAQNPVKKMTWQVVLEWLHSDKSGLHPGDLFTPGQVRDALKIAPATTSDALKQLAKLKRVAEMEHGKYRLELPATDTGDDVLKAGTD